MDYSPVKIKEAIEWLVVLAVLCGAFWGLCWLAKNYWMV
jgi:hypothetical protein